MCGQLLFLSYINARTDEVKNDRFLSMFKWQKYKEGAWFVSTYNEGKLVLCKIFAIIWLQWVLETKRTDDLELKVVQITKKLTKVGLTWKLYSNFMCVCRRRRMYRIKRYFPCKINSFSHFHVSYTLIMI